MAGPERQGRSNPVAGARLAANFLAKPNGPRVAVLERGGWDTNFGQAARLTGPLRQLDAVIAALHDTLAAVWRDTVIVVATNFGRTAVVDGTGGTDHGTGGAAILVGGAVEGGRVVADWPGLAPGQRNEGRDQRPTTDLRAVFAGAEHFGGVSTIKPLLGLVRV